MENEKTCEKNPRDEKRGRPNSYYDRILPNMEKIVEQIRGGAAEKQVAHNIGVSEAVWKRHKREQPYFRDKVFQARIPLIQELRGVLIKKAMGFEYIEKEVTEKTGEKGIETTTRTIYKQSLPDVAAINLALKNYDKHNWSNDPALLDIKRAELKLKQQEAAKNW